MIRRIVAERGARLSRADPLKMEDGRSRRRYRRGYLPPRGIRYWFPKRETMPARRARRGDSRAAAASLTRYAWDTSPFYRRQWDAGGISSGSSALARGFRSESARRHEKGPARCAGARAAVRRLPLRAGPGGSSTSTARRARPGGRPRSRSVAPTGDAIANAHARIMWGMGIRPGDIVFVAAIFSLYMGSWGALCRRRAARARRRSRSAPARPA